MTKAPARALMIQGTGSDVGKSLIVAGLCRCFARRGLAVAPFKPQNMSNNAAVTADGGEIGRAQALQARACGLAPSVDMNPILLKPQTDRGAQLVVRGQVRGAVEARAYQALKASLLPEVMASFTRLSSTADLVLVEGAGSPAEINLRAGDLANMGFAEAADLPVVLVGDIDRGGVIAAIVGTWTVLPDSERRRLKGFLINKFRGDPTLFDDGLAAITRHTGLEALGVIPFLPAAASLPAEDALALDRRSRERRVGSGETEPIRIAVPQLARIANFDDFDPLRLEPDVVLEIVPPGQPLPAPVDLVILPGTKSTRGDLAFLRAQGWDLDLLAHHRRGGKILGICGGYQMLGRTVADPLGSEGPAGVTDGLGLLAVDTVLGGNKLVRRVTGRDPVSGSAVEGYEIHLGRTTGPGCARPFLCLDQGGSRRDDGAVSADGRVAGGYVHGLFAADGFRHAYLAGIRPRRDVGLCYEQSVESGLDALADHLERHCDLAGLAAIAGWPELFAPPPEASAPRPGLTGSVDQA